MRRLGDGAEREVYCMKAKISVLCASIAAIMWGMPMSSQAQSIQPVDAFFVSAGAYWTNNDLKMRWNPTKGNHKGSRLDLKKDLGFDLDGTKLYTEIGGAFGRKRKHQIKAFHYHYEGDSSIALPDTYRIGNNMYVEGAAFDGDLDVKVLGLTYTWFFHKRRRSAFGIGLGAIRYDVSASFAAAALVNQDVKAVSNSTSEKAWVPQIHAEYVRTFAKRWRFAIKASYVKKPGGSMSGHATDVSAQLGYFPWKHFGFSLRYNYMDLELDFDKSHFKGNVDLDSHGPQLVATYRF